jgi:hypothetical protein
MRQRLATLLVCVVLLAPLCWCGLSEYTRTHWSSWAYLERLAGDPENVQTQEDARAALLRVVPIGTPRSVIIEYLEAYGIEPDRFVGGQFYRYQAAKYEILGLLSDPPWSFSLFCGQNTYFVRFALDQEGKLRDIIINSSGACL